MNRLFIRAASIRLSTLQSTHQSGGLLYKVITWEHSGHRVARVVRLGVDWVWPIVVVSWSPVLVR